MKEIAGAEIESAYAIVEKSERSSRLAEIKKSTIDQLTESDEEISKDDIASEIKKIEKETVRSKILNGEPRIDGRDTKTVRDINVDLNILERTHGSALFTRGETQSIVVTTLGSERSSQIIDALEGEYKDKFMLHYNFHHTQLERLDLWAHQKERDRSW